MASIRRLSSQNAFHLARGRRRQPPTFITEGFRISFTYQRKTCGAMQVCGRQRRLLSAWDRNDSIIENENFIDVTSLANEMREDAREYTRSSKDVVRLAGILAESGPCREDSEDYSNLIEETFCHDGFDYQLYRCKGEDPTEIEHMVRKMNDRFDIHGILIFYPIFKNNSHHLQHYQELSPQPQSREQQEGSTTKTVTTTTTTSTKIKRLSYLNTSTGANYKTYDDYLRDIVSPTKDVEGLSNDYKKHRTKGDANMPCTALSVMITLERYHKFPQDHQHMMLNQAGGKCSLSPSSLTWKNNDIVEKRWSGSIVTIVNRSEILGRPLASMLALGGARVYSVDETSILLFAEDGQIRRCSEPHVTLNWCLENSSVIVTGVPSPDFLLPCECISPGTTVVNVSQFNNVCEETLLRQPGIKYIPNVGIGKVTVAALEHNLIKLHKRARIDQSKTLSQ